MAKTPEWKVFNPSGEYIAACKHVEDAACLVALYGKGATIKNPWTGSMKPLWVEGSEESPAGESYDRVMLVVNERCQRRNPSRPTRDGD